MHELAVANDEALGFIRVVAALMSPRASLPSMCGFVIGLASPLPVLLLVIGGYSFGLQCLRIGHAVRRRLTKV